MYTYIYIYLCIYMLHHLHLEDDLFRCVAYFRGLGAFFRGLGAFKLLSCCPLALVLESVLSEDYIVGAR